MTLREGLFFTIHPCAKSAGYSGRCGDKHAAKHAPTPKMFLVWGHGLKTVSESTIGNIIKRHKLSYPKIGKVYHNPSSGWAKNNAEKKTKRLRTRHPIRPKDFGHIVADTVERITEGIKDYFYSAIDAKVKFALTINYKRRSSENMLDFYRRFKSVYPLAVKSWQSDNGGENLGKFALELKKENILITFPIRIVPRSTPTSKDTIGRFRKSSYIIILM